MKPAGLSIGIAGLLAVLLASTVGWAPGPYLRGETVWLILAASIAFFGLERGPARTSIVAAEITFAVVLLASPALRQMPAPALRTLAATVLVATWWITVAIPIAATSLVPLVIFPLLGILPSGKVAAAYANNNIFLFMGGFIIALGIQRWGLHRRIALHIVRVIGTRPSFVVLGFMTATAVLSMWISNTATTMMMLPIALAVIAALSDVPGIEVKRGFAPALLLGVAYGASIGGLATPIGTPPNISFLRITKIMYPDFPGFSFGQWVLAFLPLVVLFLPIAWLVLVRIHRTGRGSVHAGREVIGQEIAKLGRMGRAERRMLAVFGITALLWLTRRQLEIGTTVIPGWSTLLERWIGEPFVAGNLHDATVAVAMAVLLFLIPGDPDREGRRRALMDWETAVRLPWGILLLFGGGFALAQAFKESGLSEFLGRAFAEHASGTGHLTLVGLTSGLLSFLTEVTSNTATTEVMLPIMGDTARAMGANPLLLMVPATLSASCAFMLPIATPPNAIVFGSGHVKMQDMIKAGIGLNIAGIVIVTLVFYFFSGPLILGIDLSSVPAWAVP